MPEECTTKPSITLERDGLARARHDVLGEYELAYEGAATPLFTDNETNTMRLYGIGEWDRLREGRFSRTDHPRTD